MFTNTDVEEGVVSHIGITRAHAAFKGYSPAMVDNLFEKSGGDNAFLQAAVKLLQEGKVSDREMTKPNPAVLAKQASTIGFAGITSDHTGFKGVPRNVVKLVLDRFNEFDKDDDGRLSMDEVVVGMIKLVTATLASVKTKKKMSWAILALGLTNIVLVFLASFMAKDTSVFNGVLTAKNSNQALKTAVDNTVLHLGHPVEAFEPSTEEASTQGTVKKNFLGCIDVEDVDTLKMNSRAVPVTLLSEDGSVLNLQTHDWVVNANDNMDVVDTSGVSYTINMNDPACAGEVVKNGRRQLFGRRVRGGSISR